MGLFLHIGVFADRFRDVLREHPAPVTLIEPSDHAPTLLRLAIHHEVLIFTGGDLDQQAGNGLRRTAGQLEQLADAFDPSPVRKGGAR